MIVALRYISSGKLYNCESTLASALLVGVTSLTVTTGHGVKFPAYFPFLIQIESEITKCTALSTDTLTVERGQKATTDAWHGSGTPIRAILYTNDLDISRILTDDGEVLTTDGEVMYD